MSSEMQGGLPVKRRRRLVPLRIATLASGGEGVAHVTEDGERRAVFVPRTAPGDRVEAEVDFTKSPARGRLVVLVEPSSCRTVPSCPIVDRCGGCDWMHLAPQAQLDAHSEIVRTALQRANIVVPSIRSHPAAGDDRYRTRARVAVEADGRRAIVGFRAKASHGIEPTTSCVVLAAPLDAMLGALPPLFEGEVGRGELSLALGADGKPVIDLSWEGRLSARLLARLEARYESGACAGIAVRATEPVQRRRGSSQRHSPPRQSATPSIVIGDPRVVTIGGDGKPLVAASAGFAQANPVTNRLLTARALALVPPDGEDVVELFSGAGNFSVVLAREAQSLTTVEFDEAAVECARLNLASRGLGQTVRMIRADADAYDVFQSAQVVWLDPPRTGARAAAESIARSGARRVAYVSCHPATLGRDLQVLVASGFRVTAVETFEMFPHTSHVETVVALERGHSRTQGHVGGPISVHDASTEVR